MKDKKCTAIVLAAGQGKRMGTKVQKQFLEIDEKPILYYALKAFQDIDMDKISNNLQSIQKVLGIFGEFSKNNKVDPSHSMSKGSYRRFND